MIPRALAPALAIAVWQAVLLPSVARASVVRQMTTTELADGADIVVDAEVKALVSRWDAAHKGLETVVTLRPAGGGAPLVIVQPGGSLSGVTHTVIGMPTYQVGERATFYLARRKDGATYRVYGWQQGKKHSTRPAIEFAHNGMVWPSDRIPVDYELHTAGSDDLSFGEVSAAVAAAFATWEDVPCASLAFEQIGTTDSLGVAVDDHNVILFIESGWIYGEEAAGATSLHIIDGEQSADVAINGDNFSWAIGPDGADAASGTLDLQGILTHEFGHFAGMGHTEVAHDTMYYSWTPWPGQRTLSLDDKTGLCALYPIAGDECAADGDCGEDGTCTETAFGKLCETPIDSIGDPCNYDRIECDHFCLFTKADLSTGYCSRFCESNADCPLTHHCDEASAGSQSVEVCFPGAQPAPDAGPGACTSDDACPDGQHCGVAGACTLECREDRDCGGEGPCDDRGRCTTDGGCGCGTGATSGRGLFGLVGLLALAAWRSRRRLEMRA